MSSVDYATFVNDLHRQIRARWLQVYGYPCDDSMVAHHEWRCAVENMPQAEMLARIDPAWTPTTPPAPPPRPDVPGIEHGIAYQHGRAIWTWGSPDLYLTSWASCCRTWVNVLWGTWVTQNGMDWLEGPVRDLPAPSAASFDSDIKLKHLLSYTSQANPPGSKWSYSSGDHWPKQNRIIGELYGTTVDKAFTAEVLSIIAGTTLKATRNSDDGTLRVNGSVRDQARLALMLLANEGLLLDPTYVTRSIAGGTDGTGTPYAIEGYQTHLIRVGKCHDRPPMPTVPDGFMARDGSDDSTSSGHGAIVGIPSIGLAFSYRGASIEKVLPAVVAGL